MPFRMFSKVRRYFKNKFYFEQVLLLYLAFFSSWLKALGSVKFKIERNLASRYFKWKCERIFLFSQKLFVAESIY